MVSSLFSSDNFLICFDTEWWSKPKLYFYVKTQHNCFLSTFVLTTSNVFWCKMVNKIPWMRPKREEKKKKKKKKKKIIFNERNLCERSHWKKDGWMVLMIGFYVWDTRTVRRTTGVWRLILKYWDLLDWEKRLINSKQVLSRHTVFVFGSNCPEEICGHVIKALIRPLKKENSLSPQKIWHIFGQKPPRPGDERDKIRSSMSRNT